MKVHLVQYDVLWNDISSNEERVFNLLSEVEISAGDWIILPEMWNTGFTMEPDILSTAQLKQSKESLMRWSEQNDIYIAGSQVTKSDDGWANQFFLYHKGKQIGGYDKRYLFSPAGENATYQAGSEPIIWSIDGIRIRPFICYDLRFAAWSFEPLADVLIYVANWPTPRVTHWDALLKARAIENQAFVIGVNRVGIDRHGLEYPGHSALYRYDGEPLGILDSQAAILSVSLDLEQQKRYRKQLPFLNDR